MKVAIEFIVPNVEFDPEAWQQEVKEIVETHFKQGLNLDFVVMDIPDIKETMGYDADRDFFYYLSN
jgi:hypothetical protein